MFEMNRVAAKIKEGRIRNNLTQNALADQMGVSYQAVSNWERGNSMPDIAKLEDLCRVLDLDLYDLLGASRETETVRRVLSQTGEPADFTFRDLSGIAPYMEPETLTELVDACSNQQIFMQDVVALAPFLDPEQLEALAARATPADIGQVIALTPFVSTETTAGLIEQLEDLEDFTLDTGLLTALAPFLSQQKLGALSQRVQPKSLRSLAGLGPYLSCTALEDLISRLEAVDSRDFSALTALAPFVSSKTLSDLVLRIREGGSSPNAGK